MVGSGSVRTVTAEDETAVKLIQFLNSEFDQRLPANLSEAEREARIVELLAEDPRLAEMATRLTHLLGGEPPASDDPDAG